MNQWSLEQFEENKYSFTFEGVRNTLMCSFDRFEEFNRLSNELECLHHYKIVAAEFCPSDRIYIADSEAHYRVYRIDNE